MSFKRYQKDDSVNELFTNLCQFNNMKSHLLTKDFDVFIRWFDKLRMIDARATFIYLMDNQHTLSEEEIDYVEKVYKKSMRNR